MDTSGPSANLREPTFGDYLKAAFNVRVPVWGLGGVPLNWLYLAAVAGVGVAAWPMLLVGAAGEIAFLSALAGNRRFQQAVRAARLASRESAGAATVDAVAARLSPQGQERYRALTLKCDEVLEIARTTANVDPGTLDSYTTNLVQLREVYARMLALQEAFQRYSLDWSSTDPEPEIRAIEAQLQADGLSDQMRSSRQATLAVLKKRAETRREISSRAQVVDSEIGRLAQQVELLRDQVLLTRDPQVLSANMDVAADLLEERSEWLQDNAVYAETLGQMTQTQ
jgi:hypothetical protein